MLGVVGPQWNALSISTVAFQAFMLTAVINEAKGQNTGYGKFAKPEVPQWPSRVGMSIVYLFPSLTSVLGLLFLISTAAPAEPAVSGSLQQLWQLATTHRGTLIAAMLSLHFIKRELEVQFVHVYTGGTEKATAIAISMYYSLHCLAIMYFSSAIPSSQLSSGLILQLGTALFLVGTLGNAYHHYLLSTLRSKAEVQQKKRKVPQADFASYLAGRSLASRAWSLKNIPEFPKQRKAMGTIASPMLQGWRPFGAI
eukprot:jgi/Astpho2/1362/Aster-x1004